MSRFDAGLSTGTTASSNRQVQSASNQPYPGDNLDPTSTGSVRNHVLRPDVPVGQAGQGNMGQANSGRSMQPLGSPSRPGSVSPAQSAPMSTIRSEPLPAPGQTNTRGGASAASAPQQLAPRKPLAAPQGEGRSAATTLTVQPGETVYNLARRFDVPVSAILAANNLSDGARLQVGQKINIPARAGSGVAATRQDEPERRTPKPASNQVAVLPQTPKARDAGRSDGASAGTQSGSGGLHTVASGDTLYGISRQTGVSVERLKAANDLSDGYLHVGQKLTIPGAGPGAGEDASPEVAKAEPDSADVDATTTGDTRARTKNDGGAAERTEPRKVSTQAPRDDDAVGKESRGDQLASLPDSTGVGRLRWPVDGRVINAFGAGEGSSGDGMDIAVPDGTPVKAAENGVVIYAGNGLKEFGNTVLVRHEDGLVTVYGHASKLEVKRGDAVKRGQTVALSGMSGNANRPKLHFEVRKDSTPVDPAQFLN